MPRYAAVWFDDVEARVFFLEAGAIAEETIEGPHRFAAVARRLDDVDAVLVVGPATPKLAFLRFLHAHEPALERRVCGIETVAHPSDATLLAYAQHYFNLTARARG